MSSSLQQPTPANHPWRGLLLWEGFSALGSVGLIVVQVAVFAVWPPVHTVGEVFALMVANPVLGLVSMDALYIVNRCGRPAWSGPLVCAWTPAFLRQQRRGTCPKPSEYPRRQRVRGARPHERKLMRQQGTITRWNDDRGYGFITPSSGGPAAFVHVSSLTSGSRPSVGSTVTYRPTADDQGRPRAVDVRHVGSGGRHRRALPPGTVAAVMVAAASLVLVGVLAVIDILPLAVPAALLTLSLVAFLMYRFDKLAAVRGERRIPESSLHLVSLLGGWPGALVARHVLRHKTRKQPFRTAYWLTVVANCCVIAWMAIWQPLPF